MHQVDFYEIKKQDVLFVFFFNFNMENDVLFFSKSEMGLRLVSVSLEKTRLILRCSIQSFSDKYYVPLISLHSS